MTTIEMIVELRDLMERPRKVRIALLTRELAAHAELVNRELAHLKEPAE